jgi:hypothetical protein
MPHTYTMRGLMFACYILRHKVFETKVWAEQNTQFEFTMKYKNYD